MNKRTNKELFLPKIMIAIALIAILGVALWGYFGQDTVAVKEAREAYAQYLSENPGSHDKDFIYIYNDTVIVAIRNGKIVRKEYATEADAVKAALGSKDGANYSLSGTGDGKLFVVKLFQKTDDIYALGAATLATGAEKLTIKVVSNGMIFATFEIPAEAIDRKQSPVGVTIKKIDPEDYITLREDQGGFGYDIDVTNLVENNTARIAITINGPKGLVADANKSPITAYHKDKVISSTYDAKTGQISFSTTSFSPFPFTIENVKEADSPEKLRELLQKDEAVNIKLTASFTIDLKTDRDGHVEDSTATNKDANDRYYSSGYYNTDGTPRWLYFGAVVRGIKYLDLNGFTLTYTNTETDSTELAKYEDSALFCVDGGTYFGIGGDTGTIRTEIDEYTVWAVEDNCVVSIHGGNFVADKYAGATADPNRSILYSSSGEIHVYGGKFYYENTNEGDTEGEFKTNGGFNVLDGITKPSIWIYPGVYMSEPLYRQSGETDNDSIILVGGTVTEYNSTLSYGDFTGKWYTIKASDLKVSFEHTDKILYRVGNLNGIDLSKLFKFEDGSTVDFSKYNIRVVDIIKTDLEIAKLGKDYDSPDYYAALSEQLVEGATCTGGVLTFPTTFTGPVKIGLYDETSNAIHAQLYLEVVDGKNVTSAMSATGNNVCLLSDITTSTSISVKNGYALYGNGFTIHDERDNPSKDSGIINVDGGTLDNVQIMGYTPESSGYLNYSDAGRAPIVSISGNSNVYNSYIYGGHSAVMIIGGTIRFENVLLDGGGFCNLWLNGKADVTFKDCTTTIDTHNGPVGMGIVVSNTSAKIRLEGTLKQYNWVTEKQAGDYATYLKFLYEDGNFAYNGYLNVGIFFADPSSSGGTPFPESVVEQIIEDENFDYKDQYEIKDKTVNIALSGDVTAGAYIPKATETSKTWFGTPVYTPSGYEIYKPSYSFTLSDKDNIPNKGNSTDYCEYDGKGTVTIGTTKAEASLDLSNIVVNWYNRPVSYKLYIDGSEVSENVSLPFKTSYTVTIKTTVCSRTSNGEPMDSDDYEDTLTINMIRLAIPNPEFVTFPSGESGHIWLVGGNSSDKDFAEAIPALGGITVKFWDDAETAYEVVLTEVLGTGSVDTTTGYATITFAGHEKLYDCVLTIYSAECKPSNSDDKFYYSNFENVNNKMYLYNGAGQHNYRTSDKDGKNPYVQTFSYTFTDRNGNSVSNSVTYSFSNDTPGVYADYNDFTNGIYTEDNPNECITPDTLITLADGRQVRVDSLTGNEMLLVWNLKTGKYEAAPIVFVDSEAEEEFEIIHLYFSDGSDVKVISEHGFFDLDLGKYVYIDATNYQDYVGHRFVTEGDISKDTWNVVTLDKVNIETEVTTAWSPVTFEHLCYYTNGVLSMPGGIEGLFNIFEVDTDTMTYDAEKMQQDIETYGLLTLEDFGGMVPQAAFDAFNGQYLGIAIGKGLLTWEDIAAMAERYVPLM